MTLLIKELNENLKKAVAHFWKTRLKQLERQQASDRKDQGARSAVTGGAQMDGFGAFIDNLRPWLGYFFLLEDCPASNRPVNVREPHFPVFPEFREASYALRYEIFCRKLVRERHYNAAALIMSRSEKGTQGIYTEPASDLSFELFARSLVAHVGAYAK